MTLQRLLKLLDLGPSDDVLQEHLGEDGVGWRGRGWGVSVEGGEDSRTGGSGGGEDGTGYGGSAGEGRLGRGERGQPELKTKGEIGRDDVGLRERTNRACILSSSARLGIHESS